MSLFQNNSEMKIINYFYKFLSLIERYYSNECSYLYEIKSQM